MAYNLFKPTGSNGTNPISVPDNAIDTALYDSGNKLGVQLIGRNAIDYGTAIAQNTIQMVSNFSGTTLPNDTISLQGQLWYNATSSTAGQLYVRVTSTASGGIANWRKLPVVNNPTPSDGDIRVVGSVISIYANGAYQQVFPPIYS
jgi:hypothetical protein